MTVYNHGAYQYKGDTGAIIKSGEFEASPYIRYTNALMLNFYAGENSSGEAIYWSYVFSNNDLYRLIQSKIESGADISSNKFYRTLVTLRDISPQNITLK